MDSKKLLELSRLLSRLDRLDPAEPLPVVGNGRPSGDALRIGVTGPLGAGKSTLIDALAYQFRQRGLTVGILAVDPSSPFTGGAVLGDRVRMHKLALDEGVFIRSLATRGASGGLAAGVIDAADILDQFGFDRIIIETVGVGQAEVDIVGACDATLVVLEPGSGDGIQAMKAGLMEIADLFVVNKKDMKGADRFILDLQSVLEMKTDGNHIDVIATAADREEGLPELAEWIEDYFKEKRQNNELDRRRASQRIDRIRRAAQVFMMRRLWSKVTDEDLQEVVEADIPVRDAAQNLVNKYFSGEA